MAAVVRPAADVKLEKATERFNRDPSYTYTTPWYMFGSSYCYIYTFAGTDVVSPPYVSGSNVVLANIRSGFKLKFDGGSSISSPFMYGTAQSSKG